MADLHLAGSYYLQKLLIASGVIPDLCKELTIKLDVNNIVELSYTVLADEHRIAQLAEGFGAWIPSGKWPAESATIK